MISMLSGICSRLDIISSSLTLKSGYHHIDILEAHQKYLGFSWEFDGKIPYFVFTVLVFGLATAPFVFTKVLCVLIKHW